MTNDPPERCVKPSCSASLLPCPCCGAMCAYNQRELEPCWGQVDVEDYMGDGDGGEFLIHTCRGHATLVNHGSYDGKYTEEVSVNEWWGGFAAIIEVKPNSSKGGENAALSPDLPTQPQT